MSFKAPLSRKRSRLLLSWNLMVDPPQLSRGLSVVLCVVNIVLPGIGTMVAGIVSDNMDTFLIGALQLVFSIFIVGWLWAIIWSVELVRRSLRQGRHVEESTTEGGEAWDTEIQKSYEEMKDQEQVFESV